MPKLLADEKSPRSLAKQYDRSFLTQRGEGRSPSAVRLANAQASPESPLQNSSKRLAPSVNAPPAPEGSRCANLTGVGVTIRPQKATTTGSD